MKYSIQATFIIKKNNSEKGIFTLRLNDLYCSGAALYLRPTHVSHREVGVLRKFPAAGKD